METVRLCLKHMWQNYNKFQLINIFLLEDCKIYYIYSNRAEYELRFGKALYLSPYGGGKIKRE